jgi:dTDP-4-amino-4,6-dideoxygalactose transaminase
MLSSIPLSQPAVGHAELNAVAEVLDSGWLAGQGPRGAALEAGFKALTQREHAIAVNNCTAGLHLALLALGIGPGDEVVIPDYTFPATGHAVLYCGASPVLADVRPDTGTLDLASAKRLVTSRTKAIVGVDSLGVPADWDGIAALAAEHDLAVIEDAACAAGGEYRGRPCGSFGHVAVFSLHARKGITSGEGGVVVTDDPALADSIRMASCFGMQSAFARASSSTLQTPVFATLGYNYKLSEVLAAIGVVQLGRLADFCAERRELADRYHSLLDGLEGVTAPQVPDDRLPSWQTYAVTVDDDVDRDAVVGRLRHQGVGANIGTYALSHQPVYAPFAHENGVAGDLFIRHLAIPMYNGLTTGEQERVVDALAAALAGQGTLKVSRSG